MIFPGLLLASESHSAHHSSWKDLIAPAINAAVFFGFLIHILRKKLALHFEEKSKLIEDYVDKAESKFKESSSKLKIATEKLDNVNNEVKIIEQNSKVDLANFEKGHSLEIKNKIEKLKQDSLSRLEAEKQAKLRNLHVEMVDFVIEKAKSTIANDENQNSKISRRLLEGMR